MMQTDSVWVVKWKWVMKHENDQTTWYTYVKISNWFDMLLGVNRVSAGDVFQVHMEYSQK